MEHLTVTNGRHPFELSFSFMAFLIGIAFFLELGLSPALVETLRHPLTIVVYSFLLAGGGVAAFGVLWSGANKLGRLFAGLYFERVGMMLLAPATITYCTAVFYQNGLINGLGTGLITGAYAVASVWRIYQITRDLHKLEQSIRKSGQKGRG